MKPWTQICIRNIFLGGGLYVSLDSYMLPPFRCWRDCPRKHLNLNRKDTLYRAKFYMRLMYYLSPDYAESTVKIRFFYVKSHFNHHSGAAIILFANLAERIFMPSKCNSFTDLFLIVERFSLDVSKIYYTQARYFYH